MSASVTPTHLFSTIIYPKYGASVKIGPPTSFMVHTLAPFFRGTDGGGLSSFEGLGKNIGSNNRLIVRDSALNVLRTEDTLDTGQKVIRTFFYSSSGELERMELSGDGVPAGVETVKTFTTSGNDLQITYS